MIKTKRVFYWPIPKIIVIEEETEKKEKEFVNIIKHEENLE
jgi:hypothetical protein